MGFNDFLDKFRAAPTPEAEQRKTTMQLLEDEKFLDFLDKVEAHTGSRVFAGLSLDEPATDELLEYHGRYKDQVKVAEQVVGGVKQEFKEAGLTYSESLKLPSSTPYRDRYLDFFYPHAGELRDAQATLHPDLAQKLADAKAAEAPDAQENHPSGEAGEDAAAESITLAFDARRTEVRLAQTEITRMKQEAGLVPVTFSDIADNPKVHTELTAIESKLSSFAVDPGVKDPERSDIIAQRDELVRVVAAEKALVTTATPARADLAKDIEAAVQAADAAGPSDRLSEEIRNLDIVDAALTEVYQAKETMGSRMEAIRAQVQEQAVSNPGAFDSLKERMATLEVKDKEVQALRKQMEAHGLEDQGTTHRLQDMRKQLRAVDKFGSDQPLLGKIRRIFSRSYRNAATQLEEQYGFSAESDRGSIKDEIAGIETLLQTPSSFQQAKSQAESLSHQIKSDVPILAGLGDTVRVALQESLRAKLAKGDLAGVGAARTQLENATYATLINGDVDVDQMKQLIEGESMRVFQKNLLEQLEAKGGKNISTILKGFDSLAKTLAKTNSIEAQKLLDFVKQSLDQIAADLSLGPRTRQYAELIRNTVEARYS
ncbi:hypothetical protein BH11PAT4_BH11PAT4_2820 [soil metagenome]